MVLEEGTNEFEVSKRREKRHGTASSVYKRITEYEKMLDEVVADESTLEEWIFDKQKAEVIFALEGDKEIGYALFFHNFSTFLGRAGIYLEDIYVKPEYRGRDMAKPF